MEGRITYFLLMITFGRIVLQTVSTSREMFTCGKAAYCSIVAVDKAWPLNFQLHSTVKVKRNLYKYPETASIKQPYMKRV